MSHFLRSVLLFALISLAFSGLQASDPLVRVRSIRFSSESLPSGRSGWLETAIELVAEQNDSVGAVNPNFVDRVAVRLALATQPDGSAASRLRFYRSETTVASLERGKPVVVRFYLPPEIIRRDRIQREPAAALVELGVEGRTLPIRQENRTGLITNASQLEIFQKRLALEASPNDGVLLPIYLTPFYTPAPAGRLEQCPGYIQTPSSR